MGNCLIRRRSIKHDDSFAKATNKRIAEMVAAADRGEIDLRDYWNIGDKRKIHLDAISDNYGFGAVSACDLTLEIMDTSDVHKDSPGTFLVMTTSVLPNSLYVTNSSGDDQFTTNWGTDVANAIPTQLRGIFKHYDVYEYNGITYGFDSLGLPQTRLLFGYADGSFFTRGIRGITNAKRKRNAYGSTAYSKYFSGNTISDTELISVSSAGIQENALLANPIPIVLIGFI